jgi:hypothetical protein
MELPPSVRALSSPSSWAGTELARRFRSRCKVRGEPSARVRLAQPVKIAALEERKHCRRFTFLDEDRQREIGPIASGGPLRRLALQTRIGFVQVDLADNAKDVVGVIVAFLHPCCDIRPARNLPFVDVPYVAEFLQLLADPERPVSVAACVADENVGHAPPPAAGDGASSFRQLRGARGPR